jgi:hypothetical protein
MNDNGEVVEFSGNSNSCSQIVNAVKLLVKNDDNFADRLFYQSIWGNPPQLILILFMKPKEVVGIQVLKSKILLGKNLTNLNVIVNHLVQSNFLHTGNLCNSKTPKFLFFFYFQNFFSRTFRVTRISRVKEITLIFFSFFPQLFLLSLSSFSDLPSQILSSILSLKISTPHVSSLNFSPPHVSSSS